MNIVRLADTLHDQLAKALASLQECADALEDKISEATESWQESETGQRAQENLDNAREAVSEIENAMATLSNISD